MSEPQPDIILAKRYAELWHAGKLYDEDLPYTFHLEQTANVAIRFGFVDTVMICAAWLHDAIEETGKSYNDIKRIFGFEVAELVFTVTDELGRNRKERQAKTYPKIRGNLRAVALKLCDRIANSERGTATRGENPMYEQEYPAFKEALYQDFGDPRIENMWRHLDSLLLRQR